MANARTIALRPRDGAVPRAGRAAPASAGLTGKRSIVYGVGSECAPSVAYRKHGAGPDREQRRLPGDRSRVSSAAAPQGDRPRPMTRLGAVTAFLDPVSGARERAFTYTPALCVAVLIVERGSRELAQAQPAASDPVRPPDRGTSTTPYNQRRAMRSRRASRIHDGIACSSRVRRSRQVSAVIAKPAPQSVHG